jgi:hypothetical protein
MSFMIRLLTSSVTLTAKDQCAHTGQKLEPKAVLAEV